MLTGLVNKQVGRAITKNAGKIERSRSFADGIARALKNFRLKVTGSLGFDYAQVTRGGVPFSEVDPATCESGKVKGLYIVGEMLDVDGDCGGYNLQWAYSSASAACEDIIGRAYENK